jgi:hypothetical protein
VAISFVGSAVNSSSPNTGTSVNVSGIGIQANDLILVAAAVGDTANNGLAAPTEGGYSRVPGVAATLYSNDVNDTNLDLYYKIAAGSETAVSFGAVGGTNASNAAVVMVFRGVDTTTPFDTNANTATGISTSNADPPSHDHSGTAGIWTVIAASTGHTGGATASFTFPANYTTNAAQRAHNDTIDVLVGMGYRTNPADPEDPAAFTAATIGTAADNAWAAVTMSLKEAPVTRRARVAWAELETLDVPAAWPAAPVKDTFTYSDGSVEGQGAWVDWPLITNGLDVNTNAVRASTAVNLCGSLYAVSQGPDVELYATITELISEGFILGLTWRQSTTTSTDTRYYLEVRRIAGSNNDVISFGKTVAGTYTEDIGGVINLGFDIAANDQIGVRMVGSNLEIWYKKSGGSWNRVGIRTDSSISTAGYAGLFIERQPGKLDDFSYSTYPPRRSQVAWTELETPNAPRRARVAFAELETPNAARRARVAFAELEAPNAPRRARIAFAELEAPNAPRRARVAFAELEVPEVSNDRRAQVAFAELEVADAPRRARLAWAELQVADAPRRARIAWAEMEVATAPRRARVGWAELEAPEFNKRARVAWAELEVPSVAGAVTSLVNYVTTFRRRGR